MTVAIKVSNLALDSMILLHGLDMQALRCQHDVATWHWHNHVPDKTEGGYLGTHAVDVLHVG
jgi:hypothetical protein